MTDYWRDWALKNPDKIREASRRYLRSARGKKKQLLHAARRRARAKGLPFALTEADIVIPSYCPILRIQLSMGNDGGAGPNSATLDRIDPRKGYVPGNIQVISHRANVMKNAAGPLELIFFAEWVFETQRRHDPLPAWAIESDQEATNAR